jgi:prepilin-type N-terminal cleavage/methylation domain-containing protein
MPEKIKREAGFTFVELLCTISLLGLLTTLAVPNITNIVSKTADQQLRLAVIAQLQQAQLIAMAKEKEIGIRFTKEKMLTIEDEQVTDIIPLPEVSQIQTNYKNNEIVFQDTGQVRGGTITLSRLEKAHIKIVIQVASGVTRMEFYE